MSKNIVNAIDIRSDKIICLVAQELEIVNKGKILQLIGMGVSKLPVDCSDPYDLGLGMLSKYVKDAIEIAENESLIKIKNAYVSISDAFYSKYIQYQVDIKKEKIQDFHIKNFFKTEEFKNLYTIDREPLHSFPISYRINNSKSVSDPINLQADFLNIKWHNIVAEKRYIRRVNHILLELNIAVKQIVINNYASSLSILDEMEADLGAITIDIGKSRTFLSFMLDNQLIDFDVLSLGTYNFSKDLSQILSISLQEANLIRKRMDKFESIDIVERKDVDFYKIYQSRAEELVDLISYKLRQSKYYSLVDKNIIFTGYGSKSLLISKTIKSKFNLSNCRLGSARKINGNRLVVDNPSYSSSFGLLAYAVNHEFEQNESNKIIEKDSIFSNIYNFFKAI